MAGCPVSVPIPSTVLVPHALSVGAGSVVPLPLGPNLLRAAQVPLPVRIRHSPWVRLLCRAACLAI